MAALQSLSRSGSSGDGKPLEVDLGTSSDPNTKVDGLVFNFVGTKPSFSSQPFQPGGVLEADHDPALLKMPDRPAPETQPKFASAIMRPRRRPSSR